jgi:imidazole glycerol-phosphate synthase subunit HisH
MRQTKINIIDYGMGNLQSVRNALERIGCEVLVSSNPTMLSEADALILPGVGAFGEAMSNLHKRKLVEPLRRAVLDDGKPLLGICLGMQLLADSSDERGNHQGLSLIPGHVRAIPESIGLRLPHIGWNDLSICMRDPLFLDLPDKSAFYFVHSYQFECDPAYISASTDYGVYITVAVQRNHIFGVQFHPERSQRKGLHLLRNFIDFIELTTAKKGS